MKKKYDLLPMNFYDPDGVETWLSDQSARGLHLLQMKTFVSFEKGEPKRAIYRVEPQSKKVPLTDEQKEMYADFGWEFVCSLKDLFVVWRSYEDNPRELHTDPVVEAELLERLYKWKTKLLFSLPLLLIFSIVMSGVALFGNPHPLLYAVRYGAQPMLYSVLLLEVILVWQLFQTYFASKRLIQQMKSGMPRPHKKKISRGLVWFQKGYLLVTLLWSVYVCFSMYWSLSRETIPLKDYTDPLPTVSLSAIESDPALKINCESYPEWPDRYCCEVTTKASDLVSYQMEFNERGEIPGKNWGDGSGTYSPSQRVNYYELRFDFLAEPLLEQMLDDHLEYVRYETVTVSELQNSAFDQAFLVKTKDSAQILLARMGNRVLELSYYGEADLTPQLDLIARQMWEFERTSLKT